MTKPYHHGDLPRAVKDEALRIIADHGVAALSLRDVARNIGVSHAAPAHHFVDKTGVLVALAVDGYGVLEDELKRVLSSAPEHLFLEAGCAYVRFAAEHPGYFIVIEQVELLPQTEELVTARQRSSWLLESAPGQVGFTAMQMTAMASWAIAHGFATLWRSGSLPATLGDDPVAAFRVVAQGLQQP